MRIRKDDLVEVIAGESAEKGRARRVIRVLTDEERILVEGVNLVYKHVKPNRRNQQGGRLSKEAPIHVSNVQLYCKACNRGVRTGVAYDPADGRKYVYCKSCKKAGRATVMRYLSKARPAYAAKKPS
jgi:large subunit ribosomal protein L24